MLCNYIFPFDPAHMFQNSPSTMTKDTRFLRLTMMKMIAEFSLSHDQTETNTNIIIVMPVDISLEWKCPAMFQEETENFVVAVISHSGS